MRPQLKTWNIKVGDRVAAFHEMRTPGGSYAEYAVAWAHTTFHLPKETSFEGKLKYKVVGKTERGSC